MQARLGAWAIALLAAAALALGGCASKRTPKLMYLKSNKRGPDEFAVLPTKPLQMPKDLAELPKPTPGGTNRTDPTPVADAVAALGGREPKAGGKVPAADSALVARASRYGVQPGIRKELAAADVDFRRHHPPKPLFRLFGVNSYFDAYKSMALNQYKALDDWRARGVRTESAPPDPATK